jgi:predicted nucleic acid-binding protein
MTIVDTSVLSGSLERKKPPFREIEARAIAEFKRLVRSKSTIGIPGIVKQELLSCVSDPRTFEKLRIRTQGFELLLADESIHVTAAEIANSCLRGGVSPATVDCLIAATAIHADAKLLTVDPDFGFMAKHCSLKLATF